MASSQKEFLLGCLIGAALGAVTALCVPKKFLNSLIQVKPRLNGNHTDSNAHATHASSHDHASERVRARKHPVTKEASKSHTTAKKTTPKKTVK